MVSNLWTALVDGAKGSQGEESGWWGWGDEMN